MEPTIAERITRKLTEELAPVRLEVIDQSDRHAGHAGADPRGESHFRVDVCSAAFEGLSRIDRQRRVHEILAEELKDRIHALSIRAKTPTEEGISP